MRNEKRFAALILIVVFSLALASPAAAVLTNIQKGESVFLGEEGLVLADDVFYSSGGVYDEQLAYFAGSNPASGSPEYVFTPSKNSFYVSPSVFSNRLGPWHSYPNGSKVDYSSINVLRPSLDLRLWAYRAGGNSFDITNGKIVKGEALDFRIDSNLYPIFQRTGVVAGDDGVDIKLKNQVGATLTALIDCSGSAVSIVNVHPTTQQFFLPDGTVACVWDTGNEEYKTGGYVVWAECNVNGMMDNLGSIEGQTITPTINSLKSTSTPTATATQAATTPPTSEPTGTVETTVSTPVQTEATQTPAETPTSTVTVTASPAELPQTGLSLFTLLISFMLAAISLAVFSKKK